MVNHPVTQNCIASGHIRAGDDSKCYTCQAEEDKNSTLPLVRRYELPELKQHTDLFGHPVREPGHVLKREQQAMEILANAWCITSGKETDNSFEVDRHLVMKRARWYLDGLITREEKS